MLTSAARAAFAGGIHPVLRPQAQLRCALPGVTLQNPFSRGFPDVAQILLSRTLQALLLCRAVGKTQLPAPVFRNPGCPINDARAVQGGQLEASRALGQVPWQ
mgnify:CR=1 FL=1